MNRKISNLIAALAMAAPAMITTQAYAQTIAAPPAVTQAAHPLLAVTQDNIQADIMMADKPSLLVVTSPNCASCAEITAAFAAQAGKHPEWKFRQADAAELGIEADLAPFVIVTVPGIGTTFTKTEFATPADMDAFMAERIAKVTKIWEARAAVEALSKQIEEKSQPFNHEMKALRDQADAISQPFKDRVAVVNAERAKALAPLQQQIKDVQASRAAAEKPFYDQVAEIKRRQNSATRDLSVELRALSQQLTDMRARNVAKDDPQMKQALDRQKALRAEYTAKSTPFSEEIEAAYGKLDQASAPFKKEFDDLRAKVREADKPFSEQRTRIENENDVALNDLRTKAADVQQRALTALGTLPVELRKAEAELEKLVYAEQE